MNKIASFKVDHEKLLPGLYTSRKDMVGKEVVTTFDIRMTRPNVEPVMDTDEIHAIEHLGATYLRNEPEFKDEVVYFGPMGCRTGFYYIMAGDIFSTDVLGLITRMFEFIRDYEGEIPGASPKECGNYKDLNLEKAKKRAAAYLEVLYNITEDRLVYEKTY